jgi:N-acetylglucosaminyl-diphospho-decaprenol L-rhamnosyltransferase
MNYQNSRSTRRVSVVIVTYRSRSTIAAALAPLEQAVRHNTIECIIVDNASGDGTADFVATHYPWVRLIRSAENLGFGRGCNAGFAAATSDHVLFLNPDAVIEPAAIQSLVDVLAANPNAAAVGPATLVGPASLAAMSEANHADGNGSLQMAGMLPTPRSLIASALNRPNAFPSRRAIIPGDAPFQTNWICGAIMMFRADAFRALGGFDPRFFLYFEETDLCLRAARAGYELWATGTATARHICGVSARASGERVESGCIAEHFYRSRAYYLSRNFGRVAATATEGALAAILGAGLVTKRLLGRRGGAVTPDQAPVGTAAVAEPAHARWQPAG